MDTHETLVQARRVLVDGRWIQGALRDGDGGYCALGAINRVAHNTHTQVTAQEALLRSLPWWRRFGPARTSVAAYNDSFSRRKKDILDLYDKAIARTSPKPEKPKVVKSVGPVYGRCVIGSTNVAFSLAQYNKARAALAAEEEENVETPESTEVLVDA